MSENLLSRETSPYLLQHQHNPVHWRAWGKAALDEAKAAGKPILLSVGYAACHWCHVMAHESFEDPATAAVMNRLFVNIKVDREERPDIDQIYMAALHALREQGGWPLTMFLTPSGEPIWGGTYFPKTSRYGRPAFVDLLQEVARLYRDEPQKIEQNRAALMERLSARPETSRITLDQALLDNASARLNGLFDPVHGGIRGDPKFPQASLLEFIWRSADRTGDPKYRDTILITLRNIAAGGIFDHLSGGFARYSVDERWLAPHFEKMLYDNAQLVALMTSAFVHTRDPVFHERIEDTIAWLAREMTLHGGAFAASIDADSEGHEGRFYVWTLAEIIDVLGPEEGGYFARTYDVTEGGNWEGVNILNRLGSMDRLPDADESRLAHARSKLLARRANRVRPATDDKVLADWNGLMIAALAFAGLIFGRTDWIDMARTAYQFVTNTMMRNGRLAHSWRHGKALFPGLATDYAAIIAAALTLHSATGDPAFLADAEAFTAALRKHHFDPDNPGYFLSADDAEALIVRPRSATDEATPSANSLMAQNLVRLWHLTGTAAYRDDADAIIEASGTAVAGNLFAAVGILSALDLRLSAIEVVIVTPRGMSQDALVSTVYAHWKPNIVLTMHWDTATFPPDHPAANKPAVKGEPTAYVCRGETCSLPVTIAADLATLLADPQRA